MDHIGAQAKNGATTTTLVGFFKEKGFSDESIDGMLRRCNRLGDVDPERASENWDYLLRGIGIAERKLPHVVRKCPKLLALPLHDRLVPTVHCLSTLQTRPGEVAAAVARFPSVLAHSVEEKLCPLLAFFQALGVDDSHVGRMLLRNPRLVSYSVESKFSLIVDFLCGLGLGRRDGGVGRVLARNPFLVGYSVEKRLRPTAEFLKSLGLKEAELRRVAVCYPEVLCRDVEKILKPNVGFLRSWGFTGTQIARLVSGYPPVLIKSVGKSLEPRMRFLVEVMGRGIDEAADCPEFFHHGLRKSLEFREKKLRERNVRCSLSEMLHCSRSKFHLKFGLLSSK